MTDLKTVKSILSSHYDLNKNPTFIFGSRATKTNRPDSDLDVLIEDNELPSSTLTFLKESFEDSELHFKVDIVLKSRIDEVFFNKIAKNLKRL